MTQSTAREIARQVEEFANNPPPEVVERLRKAHEESRRLTRAPGDCLWHKRTGQAATPAIPAGINDNIHPEAAS